MRALFVLLAGLLATSAHGAISPFATEPAEPVFVHVGDDEVIPDRVVTALAQDRAGFVWIGTPRGLLRHDGQRFRRYGSGGSGALPVAFVRTLLAREGGGLWVGTDGGGVALYEPVDERLHPIPDEAPGDPRAMASVSALAGDARGVVYVGSVGGGLRRIDPESRLMRPVILKTPAGSLAQPRIQALLVDADGALWVGHWGGLGRVAPGSAVLEDVDLGSAGPRGLTDARIQTLMQADDGRLWVGLSDGRVTVIDRRGGVSDVVRGGANRAGVQQLVQSTDGRVWVASPEGLDLYDGRSLRRVAALRHDPSRPWGLAGADVRALLVDSAGRLWAGGYGSGVQWHDTGARGLQVHRFSRYRDGRVERLGVTALLPRRHGRLWLGAAGEGLFLLDAGLRIERHIAGREPDVRLDSGSVSALAEAADNGVWVGADSGLFRFDERTGRFTAFGLAHGLGRAGVRRLQPARDGGVWVGLASGLYRIPPTATSVEPVLRADGEPVGVAVSAVAEDDAGRLWVATSNGLLMRESAAQGLAPVRSPAGEDLPSPRILGLLWDAQQRLWVDTQGGPRRVRSVDGTEVRFEAPLGTSGAGGESLGANLLEDAQGRLWTHKRVFDPARGQIHALGIAEGVDFGTGWFRSFAARPDGRLLFGGSKGLLVVDPAAFALVRKVPPLVISDLRIDGQSVPAQRLEAGLVMQPGQRALSVEFAALDFGHTDAVRYRHRLVGRDPDWIEAEPGWRSVTYAELSPGRYTLEVQAAAARGEWRTPVRAFDLRVVPAWWQTVWARIGALLGLVGGILALVQLRTAQLRAREAALERVVEQRTRELKAASDALREKSRALEEASLTDPLTGLRNRRFVETHLASDAAFALRRHLDAVRVGRPAEASDLVFFLVDIDHFKQVNDRHGHAAGDAVIRQVAERLREVFRESDHLVRWGGEEFLVVARGVDRQHAPDMAARLRHRIRDAAFVLDDGRPLARTGSIGFAAYPFDPARPEAMVTEDVIEIADQALLAAKRAGRDGWVGLRAAADAAEFRFDACERERLVAALDAGALVADATWPMDVVRSALAAPEGLLLR